MNDWRDPSDGDQTPQATCPCDSTAELSGNCNCSNVAGGVRRSACSWNCKSRRVFVYEYVLRSGSHESKPVFLFEFVS